LTVWARKALDERGGLVLVVARYVPGGRTAVTLTMGAVRYPVRNFSFFAAVAAVSWGLYCSLVGYLGGKAFEDNPLRGVILGIGLALTVTLIVEVVRHRRSKRRVPRAQVEAEPELLKAGER
jgi:membrane protein DedA with SNARE-associated domain